MTRIWTKCIYKTSFITFVFQQSCTYPTNVVWLTIFSQTEIKKILLKFTCQTASFICPGLSCNGQDISSPACAAIFLQTSGHSELTHCHPVMFYGDIDLDQHKFRQWLLAWWQWQSLEGNFTRDTSAINHHEQLKKCLFKIAYIKILLRYPWRQWVNPLSLGLP